MTHWKLGNKNKAQEAYERAKRLSKRKPLHPFHQKLLDEADTLIEKKGK